MESQIVKRRINVLSAHLSSSSTSAAAHDVSNSPHLLPMRCSNHLNHVFRRSDNITYFARQGSGFQGSFMRQQASSTTQQVNYGEVPANATDAPAFARPAEIKPEAPTVKDIQSPVEGCRYNETAPIFARPSENCEHSQVQSVNISSKELEWSPKMDVVESGFNYVVALEIPGINVDNIKVEVNNQSLIVSGNRSNWSCETQSVHKSDSFYHRREILQGPYQVVWQLPPNTNKENVSAEIQDGLLRVTIPKLSTLRWLRKTHM